MVAELDHAGASDRLRFALGCVASVLIWRVWNGRAVRILAAGGVVAVAAATCLLAVRISVTGVLNTLTPVTAGLAVFYAAIALLAGRFGLKGAVAGSIAGLVANVCLLIALSAWLLQSAQAQYGAYLLALSAETFVILGGFLTAGLVGERLARRLEQAV
jgi:hypothetical protein